MARHVFHRPMEAIVRAWTPVVSTPKLRARTPSQEILPDAFIEWGAASTFEEEERLRDQFKRNYAQIRTGIVSPLKAGDYYEEARTYEDVIVKNPEDSSQEGVLYRRTNSIAFRAAPQSAFGDPRGEQVTLVFQSSSGTTEPPEPLTNSHGESFEPVAVDPISTIVAVQWGAPFVIITTAMRGNNVPVEGGGLKAYISILDTVGIKVPDTGIGVADFGDAQYPPEGDFKDVILKHFGHWEWLDEGPDAFTSGQMWFINLAALFRHPAISAQLAGQQVPPVISLWFSHASLSVHGVMRVSVYNYSALTAIETFTDADENPLEGLTTVDQVLEALAPQNFIEDAVDRDNLVSALSESFDKNYAVPAGAEEGPFESGNWYDFTWDYLNRNVQGVLPRIVSTSF